MEFYLKDIKDKVSDLDKNIELELTNHCNARCSLCPREELSRPRGVMSLSTLEMLALRCEQSRIKKISIGGMGEPLLHPEFEKCLKILSSIRDIELSLTTNGSLFGNQFQEMIVKASFSQISISYHYFHPPSYERYMGIKQEDCISNIREFSKKYQEQRHKISIAIVLNKTNQKEIRDICRFWSDEGINRFIVLIAHNRAGLLNDHRILDEAFYADHNIKIVSEDRIICRKPSVVLKFVDWQGKVHICCNDFKGMAVLGDIINEDLLSMEMKRETVYKSIQSSLCRNCNMPSTLLKAKFVTYKTKLIVGNKI